MLFPVAKGEELLSDLTHSGMEASMDAGGTVDQASAETCAMKSKERAANIPATTLRQCNHPAHSWNYASRRKGLVQGEGVLQ